MATPLLDYSFARPNPASIVAHGFKGVLRYLAPASDGAKVLGAVERDNLFNEGLAIGLIWEWYAMRANEGHEAGIQDAQAALRLAAILQVPTSVPIFFAVDWDVSASQLPNVAAYFKAVASELGLERTGSYAGYPATQFLFDNNLVKYGYQTYAWSGGKWDERAQLRQTLNGQWNGQVDFDQDQDGLSGLWLPSKGLSQHPAAPVSAPSSTPTSEYTIKSGDTFWGLESANDWTHGTLENLNPSVNPNALRVGQVISVPANGGAPQAAPAQTLYTIKSGDTFWGLETAHGWSHGTLQGLNPGVNPSALQVGEVINVPGNSAVRAQTYAIKSGDTFWNLEAQHGWPHGTLQRLNPTVNASDLQIGEVINIP